jgi:hypothetical protein
MAAARVPKYAEWPDYGIYPCDNIFHTTQDLRPIGEPPPKKPRKCPDCGNQWWAVDGSECLEEYALIAEIDNLREEIRRIDERRNRREEENYGPEFPV